MTLLCATPAGLVLGLLAWFASGGPATTSARLEPAATQVASLRTPRTPRYFGSSVGVAELAAEPLFVLTVGPGAVPMPVLRLDGVVKSRRRAAALVAIDGLAPDWLAVGDTRSGVTLLEVTASRALFDTVYGVQEVELGQSTAPAAAASPPQPAAVATQTDVVPSGFRSPPPPASAPGTR